MVVICSRSAAAFVASAWALLVTTSAFAADTPASSAPVNAGVKVIVARATNVCFSDLVRVTGFMVPRREAHVVVEAEGSRVAEMLVGEGDTVTANQELARLTPPPGSASRALIPLRAPAAGLITNVSTAVGAPASAQAGPLFKIAVAGEIELDAEVPGLHILKIHPGAQVRISRDDEPDVTGRVRLVAPEIDPRTQLGHVRISVASNPQLRIGMFARAGIDARRSCGVAVPRSAVDHSTVQLVKGAVVETRKVRAGLVSDSSIEILEGVAEGDVVVADAGTSLHDGDKVAPIFTDERDPGRGR